MTTGKTEQFPKLLSKARAVMRLDKQAFKAELEPLIQFGPLLIDTRCTLRAQFRPCLGLIWAPNCTYKTPNQT